MNTTIAQAAPKQKPAGRVLARTLAEDMSQPVGIFPQQTITYGIPNIHDTDLA
jgi:hypothetical protein